MKKNSFIFIILFSLALVGCSNTPKKTNTNTNTSTNTYTKNITHTEKLRGKQLTVDDINLILNENFDNKYIVSFDDKENEILSELKFNSNKEEYNIEINNSKTLSEDEKKLKVCNHTYNEIFICNHHFEKYTYSPIDKFTVRIKLESWDEDYINDKFYNEICDISIFLNKNFDINNYYYSRDAYGEKSPSTLFNFKVYVDMVKKSDGTIEEALIDEKFLHARNLVKITWKDIDNQSLREFIYNTFDGESYKDYRYVDY